MNAMFTATLAAANNSRTHGRPIDTYDRGYNRGSGCNEGTDYEALHLARRGQLDQHGYHNDGFVVSDSQSDIDEDSSSDEDVEEQYENIEDGDDADSDYVPSDEEEEDDDDDDDSSSDYHE
jgi:hypothetical protein